MNEKNMNPEQIRQQKLFQKSERARAEAHRLNAYDPMPKANRQGSGDKPVKNRPTNSGPKQRPMKPIPKTSVKDVGKPAKTKRTLTQTKKIPEHLKAAWDAVNKSLAKRYGIKDPGEIQYR